MFWDLYLICFIYSVAICFVLCMFVFGLLGGLVIVGVWIFFIWFLVGMFWLVVCFLICFGECCVVCLNCTCLFGLAFVSDYDLLGLILNCFDILFYLMLDFVLDDCVFAFWIADFTYDGYLFALLLIWFCLFGGLFCCLFVCFGFLALIDLLGFVCMVRGWFAWYFFRMLWFA